MSGNGIYIAPSHLPPSRLSQNDMEIILQNQIRAQNMRDAMGLRTENVYNRTIARATVKMGNWFEEQAYWDAMEARDGELDTTNNIIANPLVISKENYTTTNRDYGSTINDADVVVDRTFCAKSHQFEDDTKMYN